MSLKQEKDWWKKALIYQVYPRSYQDTNNDGIGDIRGIINKIHHIANMGFNVILLSSIFSSKMFDFGNDVENYREVDKSLGTIKDFKELLEKAHLLNIAVVLDIQINHTSTRHSWFLESRENETNEKSDWYIWQDAKKDGTPPNNWLSVYGNSAWHWDNTRKQYFLHTFLNSEADLNYSNKEVRKAILEELKYWLEIGIDGFKLESVNFFIKDKELKDNPSKLDVNETSNPYFFQEHIYDKSLLENLEFLSEIRQLLNKYDAIAIGKVIEDNSKTIKLIKEYTKDEYMHMCYSNDLFLTPTLNPEIFAKTLNDLESNLIGDSCLITSFTDDSSIRAINKFSSNEEFDEKVGALLLALQIGFRSTPLFYQGEELAMREENLEQEYPYISKAPMLWDNSLVNAGFSENIPWTSLDEKHLKRSVKQYMENDDSLIYKYKKLLSWYKTKVILQLGSLRAMSNAQLLIIIREYKGKKAYLVYNFSDKESEWNIPSGVSNECPIKVAKVIGNVCIIEPFGFAFFE